MKEELGINKNHIDIEKSAEELAIINRILLAVNSSQTVEELCILAGEQIRKVIPFDRASIALCDESENRLRVFGLFGSGTSPLVIGAEGQLKGSVTEQALTEHRIIIADESDTEKKFIVRHEDFSKGDFKTALCVPLYAGEKWLGSLNLTSRDEDAYTQSHIELLESLRLPLSIAVEKALLLDQKERRARELEGLYTISNSFTTLTDLSETFSELPRKIAELLGGEGAFVATYDNGKKLVHGEQPGFNVSELIEKFCYQIENEEEQFSKPFFSNNIENESRCDLVILQKYKIHSVLVSPLFIKGQLFGFIYVVNRQGGFTLNDVRLIGIFGRQAAETIANVKLVNELKDVNKMKDVFLATISHELRTPLMAIKGWADILKANTTVQNDEEANEGLKIIQNSTLSLTNLITDLLDMSRLQRHSLKLNLQPLDLNNEIIEAVQAIRYQAQEKELELILDLEEILPLVKADKQRLQQIIWNLLTNAIKFTHEGGITIRARQAADNENHVAIEIQDTGEGIPEDFLPKIWDKFLQAETEQKKSGLGIGLSLVKELTEAQNGQITVKSGKDGTTFTVCLPVFI